MIRRSAVVCPAVCLLLLAGPSFGGNPWIVGDQPNDDFETITEAFDSEYVLSGHTIRVRPDTYTEAVDFGEKAVTLISWVEATGETDRDNTKIDVSTLEDTGAVHIADISSGKATIKGFTITGGSAILGGGVYVSWAEVDILDCIITENTATSSGGVVQAALRGGDVRGLMSM